jgi:hypothetical protein
MSIIIYHYPDGWGAWCPVCNEVFSFGNKLHVEIEAKHHVCPTKYTLDVTSVTSSDERVNLWYNAKN